MESEHLVRQHRSGISGHLVRQHRSGGAEHKVSCSRRVLGWHGQPQQPQSQPSAISRLAAARPAQALASIGVAAFVGASGHVLARERPLGGPRRDRVTAPQWPSMARTEALLLPLLQGRRAAGEPLWQGRPEDTAAYRQQGTGLEAIAHLDPTAAAQQRKPHGVASAQLPL